MGDTISALVFRPPPPTHLRRSRHFWIETKCENAPDGKGRIPAFFIKRRGAKVTLLFSHGNAEDLGMMFNRMKEIALIFRVNVMAYDYSGYGKSSGTPREQNCYWNIEAAFNFLVKVRGIQPEQIVLYGRSLGSGPSCHLAAKTAAEGRSVGGVILHSPFLSVYRIVLDPGFGMMGDMFPNINKAPNIQCPVLIIHGTKDEIVPFWHGQELLRSIPSAYRVKPFWAEGMGHNNIEVYMRDIFVSKVRNFIERYVAASKGGHLEPLIIPEEERAGEITSPSNMFHLNTTWIRHGSAIVTEAISSRKVNEQARRSTSSGASVFSQFTENRDDDEDDRTITTKDGSNTTYRESGKFSAGFMSGFSSNAESSYQVSNMFWSRDEKDAKTRNRPWQSADETKRTRTSTTQAPLSPDHMSNTCCGGKFCAFE